MSAKEKEALNKAKKDQYERNRGQGQEGDTPVQPQGQSQNQVNNAMLSSGNNTQVANGAITTGSESNQIRVANFIQLANGQCVVRNASLKLSSSASNKMYVQ
eukprot:15320665-Ditylum_brightwellii.AAC.1